jgi:hypothetical protein
VPVVNGHSEIDELLPATVCFYSITILQKKRGSDRCCFFFLPQRTQLAPLVAAHRPARRVKVQKRDWAHVVDVNKPMKNFRELVPDMAHQVRHYSFSAIHGTLLADAPPTLCLLFLRLNIVPLRVGHVPKGGCVPSRDGGFGICCRSYIGGKNGCCRVCGGTRAAAYDSVCNPHMDRIQDVTERREKKQGHLYLAYQGVV